MNFRQLGRALATVVVAGAIIGGVASPAEAVVARSLTRHSRNIDFMISGEITCRRIAWVDRSVTVFGLGNRARSHLATASCQSGSRTINAYYYVENVWTSWGENSGSHIIELGWNSAPGSLTFCGGGRFASNLWGIRTSAFPRTADQTRIGRVNARCGGFNWTIVVGMQESWSAAA
jgi:hypothetical protein